MLIWEKTKRELLDELLDIAVPLALGMLHKKRCKLKSP